jgi:hypothetical protein
VAEPPQHVDGLNEVHPTMKQIGWQILPTILILMFYTNEMSAANILMARFLIQTNKFITPEKE